MPKLTYSKFVPKFDNFNQFNGDTLVLKQLDGDSFTMKDKDGTSMVFEGENFDRTQGVVTDGTITSAEFFDNKGKLLYQFDGINADAEMVFKAFSLDKDPLRIIHGLMDGNDRVNGSAKSDSLWGFGGNDKLFGKDGNDWLYGHRGNDELTGGAGIDRFVFQTGYDHDTVKDFDLTGTDHDLIRMDYYLFHEIVYSENAGSVTLTLPTGDALTLEGIAQNKIEDVTKYFDFY